MAARRTDEQRAPTSWRTEQRTPLLHTPIFSVERWDCHAVERDEQRARFVIQAADWVNVIPLTADERVVLVEQYRHGLQQLTLEIPGGVIDATDADPAAAARRELREETGCVADELELLGVVAPNPAIQTNRCYTFLATGVRCVGPQQPDDGEELRVVQRPLAEVLAAVQRGELCHSLVVAAFALYLLRSHGP